MLRHLEGIDHFESQTGEIARVSSRNRGAMGQCNCCYQAVHHLQTPTLSLALDHQATVMNSGDQISYAQQTGFDNAAATVAQATAVNNGAKPQSSIAWTRATADAEWIATWMVTTRQALADAGVVRGLIENQGRLMIQLEEEDQLLNGNGTPPNLSGILDQAIQTLDLTGEDNLDGVRTARRLLQATGAAGVAGLFASFACRHASAAYCDDTTIPVTSTSTTAAASPDTTELRRTHFHARSSAPTGRALIGSPRSQRPRSSASSCADS